MFRRTIDYWRKHIARVPKGYLRYKVLKLLSEEQLSGSEIMEKIEEETDGRWRPSPGSIYPLLSLLQDRGYIREIPLIQNILDGKKRYELTKIGTEFLEEQEKIYSERGGIPLFIGTSILNHLKSTISIEKREELKENVQKLFKSFIELRKVITEKGTTKAFDELKIILNETTERINEFIIKLKKEE
ncbi:MAG: helix-turn-helix transcriptional regulator [Candidatus Odinarchaeia archaeon]